jgi:outer membrane lipoprotein-sorting protein
MKRFFWGLPVLLLAAGCSGREELRTPEAVAQKMVETYHSLKSYEDRSSENVVLEARGQRQERAGEHRFAYEAPNRVYYETMLNGQRMRALAGDGQTLRSLLDPQHLLTAAAPPRLEGSEDLLVKLQASAPQELFTCLMGRNPFEGVAPRLLEAQDLGGQSMYVLEVSSPGQIGQGTTTYWIGKDDFLLHQRKRVEHGQQPAGTISVEITELRRDIKVDKPVAPTAFALDVPPGAQVREIRDPLGHPAPALAGKDLDGNPVSLASLKGKLVVLNFWAFW